MPIQFDDDKAKRKIDEIRAKEQEEALERHASDIGLPYLTIFPNTVEGDVLRLIPEDKAREAKILLFKLENKKLYVAVRDPENPITVEAIKNLRGAGFEIILNIISDKTLENCFEAYKGLSFTTVSATGSVDITDEALTEFISKVKSEI